MFDNVSVECPGCSQSLLIPSKAGKCVLDVFTAETVPIAIAQDIIDEVSKCPDCGTIIRMTSCVKAITMPLELEPYKSNNQSK